MSIRARALAVAVLASSLLAPGVARGDGPCESATRAAAAAFKARIEKLDLDASTLVDGKLPILVDARNETDKHMDIVAIARDAASARATVVEDATKARAVLFVIARTAGSHSKDRDITLLTVDLELVGVDEKVLAVSVHEEIFLDGTPLKKGKAADDARAALVDVTTVAPEAIARATKGLVEGIAKVPALAGGAFQVSPPGGSGGGLARDGDLVAAAVEEALLAAGKTVTPGSGLLRRARGVVWTGSVGATTLVSLAVPTTKDGLGLAIDVGRVDDRIFHVAPDGKVTLDAPHAPRRREPDDVKLSAKVAQVKGDRILLSVGTDDLVRVGWSFEVWRGTERLAAAVVDEVEKDCAWAKVKDATGTVEAGDSAYAVPSPEEKAENGTAVNDAVTALVKALEALPLPEGSTRQALKLDYFHMDYRSELAKRELTRAITASKKLELAKDGIEVEGSWIADQPGGSAATIDALVLVATAGKRKLATGVGRTVRDEEALVPREHWAEHFAHAFGPAEEDALVAAFRAKLALVKLAGNGRRLLARVEGNGAPGVAHLVESVLGDAGVDCTTRHGVGATPDIEVEVRVVGDSATEDGKPGASFVARIVAKQRGQEIASAETKTFKPE